MTRVLLAEANAPLRWWLGAGLYVVSKDLTAVEDGIDLLYELAENGPYDLVVASADLPRIGGAQVLAMARGAGSTTPFLLLAPLGGRRLRRVVRRAAPAALVDDPLDARELLTAARKLLHAARRPAASDSRRLPLPLLMRWRAAKI